MEKQFDDVFAKVCGTDTTGKKIEFELTGRDVKHIRRVLEFWDFIHPNLKPFDTSTIKIYSKFRVFGRLKRDQAHLDKKLMKSPAKCADLNCDEKINLTVHHIAGKRGSKVNAKENLEWLCPKHHVLKELKMALETKQMEAEKIKERIKQVEEADKTDMLGYQVNKKVKEFNGFSEEGNFTKEKNE